MKFYYECKYKSGATCGGHNLEKISIKDNVIILEGLDFIPTYDGDEINNYWQKKINAEKIEYLKIEPMEEDVDKGE